MSEKCDFCVDGVCADTETGLPCEYAEGERWGDCLYSTFGAFDPEEVAEIVTRNREGGTSVDAMRRKAVSVPAPDPEEDGKLRVVYLPVELIDHHPDNPRRRIGDVTELADSIRSEGIQQPLTVIAHVGGEPGRYTAVIGHRRLEAAKKAGLKEVPAFVREMDRREQLRTMMTENTQREDLTPLEEADGFQQIMFELPEQTVAAVARETGFSETTVRRRMRLLELPRDLIQQAEERGGTMGDYEKLAAIKDPSRKAEVLKTIGTDEFRGAMKDAMEQEEKLRHKERLIRELKALGVKEIPSSEVASRADLECKTWVYSYRWKEGERAASWLEPGRVYVFCTGEEWIRVLRVRKGAQKTVDAADEKAKAEERERRRLRAVEQMEQLHAEMTQMVHDFRLSREDFVGSFDLWERHREEIMAFAVRMILGSGWMRKESLTQLADWLGISVEKEHLEQAGLRRMLRLCPEKVLLYTAYWSCEGDYCSYTQLDGTDCELNTQKVFHAPNTRTDILYEGLAELGYLMSEDERRWQRGTLPQYDRAKEIAGSWKKG